MNPAYSDVSLDLHNSGEWISPEFGKRVTQPYPYRPNQAKKRGLHH